MLNPEVIHAMNWKELFENLVIIVAISIICCKMVPYIIADFKLGLGNLKKNFRV